MYSLHRFKKLSFDQKVAQLGRHGIALDLAYEIGRTEAVLFAYLDFYVEMVVEKYNDEIISIRCFQDTKKLVPFLPQVDIAEITTLLSFSR